MKNLISNTQNEHIGKKTPPPIRGKYKSSSISYSKISPMLTMENNVYYDTNKTKVRSSDGTQEKQKYYFDSEHLGFVIAQLRELLGIKAKYLAFTLGHAPAYISMLESGKREIKIDSLQRIAYELNNIPVEYITLKANLLAIKETISVITDFGAKEYFDFYFKLEPHLDALIKEKYGHKLPEINILHKKFTKMKNKRKARIKLPTPT